MGYTFFFSSQPSFSTFNLVLAEELSARQILSHPRCTTITQHKTSVNHPSLVVTTEKLNKRFNSKHGAPPTTWQDAILEGRPKRASWQHGSSVRKSPGSFLDDTTNLAHSADYGTFKLGHFQVRVEHALKSYRETLFSMSHFQVRVEHPLKSYRETLFSMSHFQVRVEHPLTS